MNTLFRAFLDWLFGWAKEAVDDWRAGREARLRGAAEERERALREAEKAEATGNQAGDEASARPADEPDEFMRPE